MKLSSVISVSERFARSINLDRDIDLIDPLRDYILTGRALDVVERMAKVAANGKSGGAWSLTGPYGSGKSSLALLIDAAFGPRSQTRDTSWKLIEEASPEIAKLIFQSHERAQTLDRGFHRGVVTANRELLSHTILRALYSAVHRSYGKIPSRRQFNASRSLIESHKIASSDDQSRSISPTSLIEIAKCLATDAPLLLVVDEFGKNLEAIKENRDADPYLLQQLAEIGQGFGLPIFILTLQHQSFEDYFAGSNKFQRQEWSKVQGRFEDIPYIESHEQSKALISSVFRVNDQSLCRRINDWANKQFVALSKLGIMSFVTAAEIASCYPLHPLTTLVLPELCNRFGQHERTMFSFLTGGDSSTAATLVNNIELNKRSALPTVDLASVFDYFVAGGTLVNLATSYSSRWIELATRIRDVQGLSNQQLELAKSIAILNLISTSGNLRASRQILELTGPNVGNNLEELESIGLVIYRQYADEYRIWHGSGIKINELVQQSTIHVENQHTSELLEYIEQPLPIVAARHSAEKETLRVFRARYSDGIECIEPLGPDSPYDGELIMVIGDKIPKLTRIHPSQKPTVCAIPKRSEDLIVAIRNVAALKAVSQESNVKNDFVAFNEIVERVAVAKIKLQKALHEAYSTSTCRWVLLDGANPIELDRGDGSAPLSEVADRVYVSTPFVPNEMLNRAELSTQGAKARRLVIEAMIAEGSRENLGLEGFGPEVAIYEAMVKRSGIHGYDSRNNVMAFRKPTDESYKPAWDAVVEEFNRSKQRRVNIEEIFAKLMSPPFGVKAGTVPILFTAALLAFRDEIAIYEHGTFKPLLTPEISERMVKNPVHFDIKHFSNTSGARRQVVEELAKCFDLRPSFRKHRVSNVLTVVGYLVSQARQLNNFAIRTKKLDKATINVRDALLSAVEPDELLFDALPIAVGYDPVTAEDLTYKNAKYFATDLKLVLGKLVHCYKIMLTEHLNILLEFSTEKSRSAISGQAESLIDEVLDPKVKSFIITLSNHTYSDIDWIKAVATVVRQKAPEEWIDDDCVIFQHELKRRLAAFRRLLALHAEHRAFGDGGFIPIRVTLTKPNGSEFVDLISIDDDLHEPSNRVLDETLEQLKHITGSENLAKKTLLALVSDRIIRDTEEIEDGSTEKQLAFGKTKHG